MTYDYHWSWLVETEVKLSRVKRSRPNIVIAIFIMHVVLVCISLLCAATVLRYSTGNLRVSILIASACPAFPCRCDHSYQLGETEMLSRCYSD